MFGVVPAEQISTNVTSVLDRTEPFRPRFSFALNPSTKFPTLPKTYNTHIFEVHPLHRLLSHTTSYGVSGQELVSYEELSAGAPSPKGDGFAGD